MKHAGFLYRSGTLERMTKLEELEIKETNIKIDQVLEMLRAASEYDAIPAFVNLETAAEKKGGAAYDTYRTRKYLQPCCGKNTRKVGGRKCWSRKDIIEWLAVSDADLPQYAAKWNVSLPQNFNSR